MRVMEGLEGASAEAGGAFDKQAMERTLAGLGSRVFLMNNVHEDTPQVFHTRWAMSYLAGPLARDRIKQLMDPVRKKFLPPEPEPKEVVESPEKSDPQTQPATKTESPTDQEKPAADLAKIEASYGPKLEKASKREEKANAYYREQFWQVPGKLFSLLFRGITLLMAMVSGGATKRKSSSAMAAFERTVAEIAQANTAWGKLRSAQEDYNQLENEKRARLGSGSPARVRSISLLMHPMIWIGVLLAAAVVVIIVGVVLFMGAGGSSPPT